ncbi:MAG TPA: metal-dependent hydrolase [Bryobacteraceae bacterium]|jgi:L-ascorbate metabolism protein UlaG (beta-lactamase superfamily)|nr:metal-dependent hydrolase [Bryobacteraceae bacterium]
MVEITWLGHATFQFRLDSGEVIVMDPWVEGNPKYPKDHQFNRIDAILVSHAHFDHIHDAVPLAKKFKPKVVAIFETCLWLTSKGVETCSGMNKGGTQDVGPLKVTMTHAIHSCGIQDGDQVIYGGEAAGYVLHLKDGRTIYFSGDTAVFSDMQLIEKLYHPDLAFLPIGDFYTMGPREAALACRLLKPKKVIPMHFGTFPALTGTPDEVAALLKDFPQSEIWPLEIGKPVKW